MCHLQPGSSCHLRFDSTCQAPSALRTCDLTAGVTCSLTTGVHAQSACRGPSSKQTSRPPVAAKKGYSPTASIGKRNSTSSPPAGANRPSPSSSPQASATCGTRCSRRGIEPVRRTCCAKFYRETRWTPSRTRRGRGCASIYHAARHAFLRGVSAHARGERLAKLGARGRGAPRKSRAPAATTRCSQEQRWAPRGGGLERRPFRVVEGTGPPQRRVGLTGGDRSA